MANYKILKQDILSNGDTIRIACIGRLYYFNVLHYDDTPPDMTRCDNKTHAYKLYADTLQADVLEID